MEKIVWHTGLSPSWQFLQELQVLHQRLFSLFPNATLVLMVQLSRRLFQQFHRNRLSLTSELSTSPTVATCTDEDLVNAAEAAFKSVSEEFLSGNELEKLSLYEIQALTGNRPDIFAKDFVTTLSTGNDLRKLQRQSTEEYKSHQGEYVPPLADSKHISTSWLTEWLRSGQLMPFLLEQLKQSPEILSMNKEGISTFGNAYFGVKRAGFEVISTPEDPKYIEFEQTPFKYYRTITVFNERRENVFLLDIRTIPNLEDFISLKYDHKYALENSEILKKRIWLPPQSEYQIIIVRKNNHILISCIVFFHLK